MKKNFRVMLMISVFLIMNVSTAFAEIPGGTVIVNGKAYSFEYFNSNIQAVMEVGQAINGSDNVYVKVGEGPTALFMDVVENTIVESDAIPEVEYYDPDGNTTIYAEKNGDEKIVTTPTVQANFTTETTVGSYEFGTIAIQLENIEGASSFEVEYVIVAGEQTATQTTQPVGIYSETEAIAKPDAVKIMVYDEASELIATFENVPLDGTSVQWNGGENNGDNDEEVEDFFVVDIL